MHKLIFAKIQDLISRNNLPVSSFGQFKRLLPPFIFWAWFYCFIAWEHLDAFTISRNTNSNPPTCVLETNMKDMSGIVCRILSFNVDILYRGISRKAPGGWGFYFTFQPEASPNKNPTLYFNFFIRIFWMSYCEEKTSIL